jgi:hypothetical protein
MIANASRLVDGGAPPSSRGRVPRRPHIGGPWRRTPHLLCWSPARPIPARRARKRPDAVNAGPHLVFRLVAPAARPTPWELDRPNPTLNTKGRGPCMAV